MDTHIKNFSLVSQLSTPKKIANCGLMIAVAFVLSYLESLIPIPAPIPGIKLGLANIISLIALYKLDGKFAMTINIGRILLFGFLFSGIFAMLYALCGGILSVLVMIIIKKTNAFSIIGVSVAGGTAHIIGQIIFASLIMQNSAILISLPILLIPSVISGILIGTLSQLILKRL